MHALRHAFRSLAKTPGFTLVAILTLALGIGANTAIFSAINTLFLRPLPYPEPAELLRIYTEFPESGIERGQFSWPRFSMIRDQQQAFSAIGADTPVISTLTGRGDPEQLATERITSGFFSALGVKPVLGRAFTAADDAPGGPAVVLISQGCWQKSFGGRADIIGQSLVLNGRPSTVIGVMPALGLPFENVRVWAPRVLDAEGVTPDLIEHGTGYLNLIARLRPGVTLTQAAEQMNVIRARYGAANPGKVDAHAGITVLPLQEDIVGRQRPVFLTLLAAVGCVLLVACANVANLLLARFSARRKEIALRAALGAPRFRIIAQFLLECVLTATLAGILGVLLAVWSLDVLARAGENFIPRAHELHLDSRVLFFALGLSLLTGLVLGLFPSLQASRADAAEALKGSSRGSTSGRHARRFRSGLLVAEVALSLVLLVSAALLIDSFRRLQRVDPGFRPENVTLFRLELPPVQYPSAERRAQFFEQAFDRIRALPGVTVAAAADNIPIVDDNTRSPAAVEGRPLPPVADRLTIRRGISFPGFFNTIGVRIKEGRDFTWRDRAGAPNVVLINEVLARRLFPGEDPVSHRLITGIQSIPREIVGVFGAMRSDNLALPAADEMFYPAAQADGAPLTVAVRSSRSAASLRSELAAAIHEIDPGLPVADVVPYSELLSRAISDRRMAMSLLGVFAGLALTLAGTGIYSVIAYGVAQRTNEIGVRMALGAAPGAVVTMVVKEGMRLAALGLVTGLAASLALTRLMSRLLYDTSATDPFVLGSVALFLAAIAAIACYIPARRATKIDPIVALRAE